MKRVIANFICLILLSTSIAHAKQSHPFLILNQEGIKDLKARAQSEQFAPLYRDVVQYWNSDDWSKLSNLARQLSAATLVYAVEDDEQFKLKVRNQILSSFDNWLTISPTLGESHASTVYGAGALFNAIIALDMIYSDCEAEQIAKVESQVADAIHFFEVGKELSGHQFQWKLARYGVLSAWYAYKQDEVNLVYWAENYKRILLDESITSDGSWCQSPGYCMARMFGTRVAKSNCVDILQAIGYYDFYADTRMEGLMNWLNHFALTPFGYTTLFGESGDFSDYSKSEGLYLVNQYSEEHSANSEFYLKGQMPNPKTVNIYPIFALMDDNRQKPQSPKSVLMTNTGASFWQYPADSESLQGILYSLRRENWGLNSFHHYSQDANSIGIQGYGEFLIANAGTSYKYGYPGYTPEKMPLTSAWLQNVVTTGNNKSNEAHGPGGGVLEGFIGDDIEYAKCSSGASIDRALHERSLFMIHPVQGQNDGYYAVYDVVNFAYFTTTANIHWQFNTKRGDTEVIKEGVQYRARATALVTPNSDGTEAISLFIATPADSVMLEESYKATHQKMCMSDQLITTYSPNRTENNAKALTLLFPEDGTHKCPEVEPVKGDCFNGAIVHHQNGGRDILIESEDLILSTFENLSFKADMLIYRNGSEPCYTTTGARYFMAQIDGERYGVSCNNKIAMQLNGKSGQIIGSNHPVTIYHPRAKQLIVDGVRPEIIESGKGWVKIMLSQKMYNLKF